jgi:hypothetical protein
LALAAGLVGALAPMALAQEECAARICSVTTRGFTAVWESPGELVTGSLRVGPSAESLDRTVCDVRDDGAPCDYAQDDTRYVRVEDLQPDTTYFLQPYEDGEPLGGVCQVTTAPVLDPPVPDADFGRVLRQDGQTPAAGTYVVLALEDAQGVRSAPLCGLVLPEQDGHWSTELSSARSQDLDHRFARVTGSTTEIAEAFGGEHGFAQSEWSYGSGEPAPLMILEPYCPDGDDDGFADCSGDCPRPGGRDRCGDCDDADPGTNPEAPDLCNQVDDDCDPATADGSGDPDVVEGCDGPDADGCREGEGTCVAGVIECDDASGDSPEICDSGLDDDCDGEVDEATCRTAASLCDADGSGRCDGYDLGDVGRAFGAQCGDPRYDPELDFNKDCLVDGEDLDVLALGFGQGV